MNSKREDKTNGDLVTVDTVGYSDDVSLDRFYFVLKIVDLLPL